MVTGDGTTNDNHAHKDLESFYHIVVKEIRIVWGCLSWQ
jgi:hypothetical protein